MPATDASRPDAGSATIPGLVSVITIFLDPGPFFEQAIESVLRQTYPDVEYLLVDDGSRDGSSEVACRIEAANPDRVIYLEHAGHENLGMSRSRNVGLAHARGEFVAFLDADDVWLDGSLERQVALLRSHPEAAMVVGATTRWRSWADGSARDHDQSSGQPGLVGPPVLARKLLHQRSFMPPSINAILARRRDVLEVGGFEDSYRDLFEDQVFFFKFFLRHAVFVHHEVVDLYREHPGSAVAKARGSVGARPFAVDRPRQAFRRFAVEQLVGGRWQGSELHRDAVWLFRWDRWPGLERQLYRLRPGVIRRIAGRVQRRFGRRAAGR